jgi:hypothetical protein
VLFATELAAELEARRNGGPVQFLSGSVPPGQRRTTRPQTIADQNARHSKSATPSKPQTLLIENEGAPAASYAGRASTTSRKRADPRGVQALSRSRS